MKKLLDNISAAAAEIPHREAFDARLAEIRQQSCTGDAEDPVLNYGQVLDKLFGLPELLNLDSV